MAAAAVTELTVDARGAQAGLAAYERAMDGAHAKAEELRRSAGKVFDEIPTSVDRVTRAYDRLRGAIDPVVKAQLAAEREMTRALALVDKAVMLGVTTQVNATAQIEALRSRQIADIERVRQAQIRLNDTPSIANDNNRFVAQNAMFQLQDIGMMAMAGQAPLVTAVQQGTQLAGALGPLGAAGAARALGAALLGLVSPVSIIAVGLTGAAAAAIQYFASWGEAADESETALKEQAELIARVAARWGDAMPKLRDYNDELQRQKDIQDRLAVGNNLAREQYDDARGGRGDLSIDFATLIEQLRAAEGANKSLLVPLQDAYDILDSKIAASTATAEDAQRVQSELNKLMEQTGIPVIQDYADQFEELAQQLGSAAKRAGELRTEAQFLQEGASILGGQLLNQRSVLPGLDPLGGFYSTPFQTLQQIEEYRRQREQLERESIGIPTPTPRPLIEMEADPRVDRAREMLKTQLEQIDALRLEASVIGQTDAARARAVSQMQVEQDIRRMGIDLHGEEANALRANAEQITEYKLRLADLARQQDEVNERAEFFGGLAMGVLDDLASGADGAERALRRVVSALADAVLQALLLGQGPFAAFFGTAPAAGSGASVGGWIGQLFNGGASAASSFKANTTLTEFLGGAGSNVSRIFSPANSNVAAGLTSAGGVEGQVWNFFAGKGLAPHQIAGIMGNISAESAFNPSAVGDAGKAFGLFQHWSNRGGGAHMLGDTNAQLNLAWKELQSSERPAFDRLLASRDVRGATAAFAGFERPLGWSEDNPEAAHNFTGRLRGAEEALGKFGGSVDRVTNTAKQAASGLGQTGVSASRAAGSVSQMSAGMSNFSQGMQQFLANPMGGGSNWFQGLIGSFGGIGGAFSFMNAISPAATLDIISGSWGLFAKGGVFDRGLIPFAQGGIVNRPTIFPFAQGVGLMGEAGPEAIMPLRRGPDGGLGVAMHGGGARVTLNVINNAGAQVRTQERQGPEGTVELDVIIDQMIADKLSNRGTAANRALRTTGALKGR